MSMEELFEFDVDTTNTSSFNHSYIDIIDPYILPIIQSSGKIIDYTVCLFLKSQKYLFIKPTYSAHKLVK